MSGRNGAASDSAGRKGRRGKQGVGNLLGAIQHAIDKGLFIDGVVERLTNRLLAGRAWLAFSASITVSAGADRRAT